MVPHLTAYVRLLSLPFEFVSSLLSSCPCLRKDPFVRKPTDKYTTGHLKLHDLNWNSLLLRCAVDLKHYLQYMHLQPPKEANLLLCYYANTLNLLGINLQGFIHRHLAALCKNAGSILTAPYCNQYYH